jgi:hypothetical protein
VKIQAFLKGTFIPQQPGGYWCCADARLPPTPSSSTRPHLHHFYYQVIEWSHSSLTFNSAGLERSNQCSQLCSKARRHTHAPVRGRPARMPRHRRRSLHSPRNHRRCRDYKISDEMPVDAFSSPPDHLGYNIDSKGAGSRQLPKRRCVMIRRATRHLLYQVSQNRRLICSKDLQRIQFFTHRYQYI